MKRATSVDASFEHISNSTSYRHRDPTPAKTESIKEQGSPSLKPVRRHASRVPMHDENTKPGVDMSKPVVQCRPSVAVNKRGVNGRVLGDVGNRPSRRMNSESFCRVSQPRQTGTTLIPAGPRLDKSAVKMLYIHAARSNATNSRGDTALNFAIRENRPRLVSLLLDPGLDLNLEAEVEIDPQDRARRRPIKLAFELGHADIARQLLESVAHAAGFQALPLTFCCAGWGRPDFIQHLLTNGANVDATDASGGTLLIAAAANNDLRTIDVLMQYGANWSATTHDGVNAAMAAATNGHLSALQLFIEDIHLPLEAATVSGLTAVLLATMAGHVGVVKYLAARGANMHALTRNGEDIIMLAATNGHLAVLRYLIEKLGIPANVTTDQSGFTALHAAASRGHLPVVEYLVTRSAIGDAKTDHGESVADVAARNGQLAVLEFLKSREPETGAGLSVMTPADFMAQAQSTPAPRTSPIDGASRLAPLTQEQRLFDVLLAEIEAQRPVTSGRFNAWLARAREGLWTTPGGTTRFLKALEVLVVCLRALPPHDVGAGRGKSLNEGACVKLVAAELVRYSSALRPRGNQPGAVRFAFHELRGHLKNHMKMISTTHTFLWILNAGNVGDRLGLKKVVRAETRGERAALHRRPNHRTLVAEYRQAHLEATASEVHQ
jgi:ankyrin repeat protein